MKVSNFVRMLWTLSGDRNAALYRQPSLIEVELVSLNTRALVHLNDSPLVAQAVETLGIQRTVAPQKGNLILEIGSSLYNSGSRLGIEQIGRIPQ